MKIIRQLSNSYIVNFLFIYDIRFLKIRGNFMRKKMIIAGFFVTLLLMVPCISAFEMNLTNDQKKNLEILINNEDEPVRSELEELITEDGSLNIDELELILEDAILTGDYTILETDPWNWIIDRLGWVYITVDYVLNIYYAGMELYGQITDTTNTVTQWFESIQNIRAAWQAFKADPINFQNIVDLINSVIDLLNKTIDLLEEVQSDDLINSFNNFKDSVIDFKTYLEGSPWDNPITIYREVTGVTEAVTISTHSDSTSTMTNYSITYDTTEASMSWFVHKCEVTADYKDKTKAKSGYAFSMGSINIDWKEADFTAKSKTSAKLPFTNLNMVVFKLLERFLSSFRLTLIRYT